MPGILSPTFFFFKGNVSHVVLAFLCCYLASKQVKRPMLKKKPMMSIKLKPEIQYQKFLLPPSAIMFVVVNHLIRSNTKHSGKSADTLQNQLELKSTNVDNENMTPLKNMSEM